MAIVDPDDTLVPETTDSLLKAYDKNPGTGLVYSKYERYDESFTKYIDIHGGGLLSGKTSLQHGFIGHILSFRICTYSQTVGFEENISFAEDRDIAYKLEEVAVPIFINKILYKQCIVPNSQSNDKRKAKIGFINHLKAKENALKRRQIFGFEMFYYRLIFWANHCRNSSRIPNRLFSPFINTLNVADDHFQIRSIGILRRPAAQKNVL